MVDQLYNELPFGWAKAEFQDIVESFKRGPFGSAIKKEFFVPDGFKVYEQKNAIYDDPFRGEYYIDKVKYDELAAFKIKPRDFIVSCSGTIGRILMLPDNPKPGIINQALLRIRIDERLISHNFFLYLFRSEMFQKLILVETRGSAMKNITGVKDLKLISITIPPLPEQHRIAAKIEELFSELDNGIENLKKVRKQLKTYRQAVLKYAFEGKLTKEWRALQRRAGNPPEQAEKLLEQIKTERGKHYQKQLEDWKRACEQAKTEGKKKPTKPKKPKELPPLTEKELAELPELPQGWCWVRTEQVGHIETGTTPSKKSPENYGKEHPFYKPTDLNEGKNVRKAHDNLSEVGYSKARLLPINSILVTCIGATIGKTGIIREEGAFNQQINAIIPFNYIVPEFVYYQAICQFFQNQIIFKASSTTLPILNKSKFENLFFALTSYEEQHTITSEIESRLSVCDKIEQTIEDSLKKAEALRQSILKKAFAGELTKDWREKHLELITGENSAEKLLENIKAEKVLADARKNLRKSKRTKKK